MEHVPVLSAETVALLVPHPGTGGFFIDATVGAGGHAHAILSAAGPQARLLAIDQDKTALPLARERLAPFAPRVTFLHANFASLLPLARAHGASEVTAILLDLGLSSMQLDHPERGFSFLHDGPLDMRMNPSAPHRAIDLLHNSNLQTLERLIRLYGGERDARRIAKAIKSALARGDNLDSTTAFAALISRVKGGRHGRTHPATRTFQALRIALNGELDALSAALPAALHLLAPHGRLGVISFHSLEDRAVKHFMTLHEGRMESLPAGGARWLGEPPRARRLTPHPIRPSLTEITANPRARSAKLRVLEKEAAP